MFYFDIEGLPFLFPLVLLALDRNKVIIAAHHVITPEGAINYRWAKLYNGLTLGFFKNFQVFSKNQYAALQNRYKGKNVLLAPFALPDFGTGDFVPPKDRTVFLFFGYIRDYKRVDILINAANRVYERTNKKFAVKIYGSCVSWEKYEKLIRCPEIFELKIGIVPNEEIPRLFKESHYLVMPYQDLAQSGALAVAFTYNLPAIASDIGAFKEQIIDGETGFLFEKGSTDSLAAVMLKVLDMNLQDHLAIKANLAKYVDKNFSTESIVQSYVDFFESYMHRRQP